MHIPPLSDDEVQGRGLAETDASFSRLGDENVTFTRILGHAGGYAEAMWGAMAEALFEGGVDHQLKEIIRIQLATIAGDSYFSGLRSSAAKDGGLTEERIAAGIGDFENDPQFSEAEKWALRYSSWMYTSPESVDAAFYEEGKRHFTEAQIMELGGLIATHYGMAVFMSTLTD